MMFRPANQHLWAPAIEDHFGLLGCRGLIVRPRESHASYHLKEWIRGERERTKAGIMPPCVVGYIT